MAAGVKITASSTRVFFDSAAVARALPAMKRRALSRAGAFIQRRMKSSIRKSKGTSLPGQPPKSHKGHLRRLIYFAYDLEAETLVVGPTPLGARAQAPEALEYGTPQRVKNPRRTVRRVGGVGEIAIHSSRTSFNSRTKRYNPNTQRRTVQVAGKSGIGGYRYVSFGRLRTAKQAARANRLSAELYGPALITLDIASRPYANPALEAEIAAGTIQEMFRDSLKP